MSHSTLDIPKPPKDLREYRLKLWTEVHMLRKDMHTVEILEQEIGDVKEEIKTVKIWGKVLGAFITVLISIVSLVHRFES
ncbi:MAG TPA: hypothetical protein EYF95_04765 [Flavobacteriales bacterium]|nr:hypothetical protein [Flavobacteriales bacterium]HIK67260.1 hypothetical protein [Flavobacteriales bacterium]